MQTPSNKVTVQSLFVGWENIPRISLKIGGVPRAFVIPLATLRKEASVSSSSRQIQSVLSAIPQLSANLCAVDDAFSIRRVSYQVVDHHGPSPRSLVRIDYPDLGLLKMETLPVEMHPKPHAIKHEAIAVFTLKPDAVAVLTELRYTLDFIIPGRFDWLSTDNLSLNLCLL